VNDANDTLASPMMAEDPLAGTAYRATSVLGRGGMAEVVEAEHLPLGRRVVVKLLHQELADDPRVADRLRVEARSLALIQHPNVVAVADFGRTRTGRPFLVTERLSGRTLGAELKARKVLPVGEAIEILLQILAGLEAAHRQGIVHRDVKPENIFLCEPAPGCPRAVKVLDFGVAKIIGEHSLMHAAPEYATKKGTFVGTPRFTAPEQMGRGEIDGRTDVYGAALVLYTLVAGRGPFAHIRDSIQLIKAHLNDPPPPPSQFAPQPIPAALDAAILKALAKAPADRQASAAAFAEELRAVAAAWTPDVRDPSEGPGENETVPVPLAVPSEVVTPARAGLSLPLLVAVTLTTSFLALGVIMFFIWRSR
jgi:serine/threonine-protein kinase